MNGNTNAESLASTTLIVLLSFPSPDPTDAYNSVSNGHFAGLNIACLFNFG